MLFLVTFTHADGTDDEAVIDARTGYSAINKIYARHNEALTNIKVYPEGEY